uniref:PRTRC system protein E n=1 Tax=Anaerolinea thermolimosa TaxID=229919 RepID=A0A7C4PK66_9CHLR
MEETPITPSETPESAPQALPQPAPEKKPEGIEHDPYEWGKCAITASIVWLPDGTMMLGARNHLDAPIITLLPADALVTLPGHAAELPIPSVETIADLLAQLREDLPLRAKAKTDRDEAARRKTEESKNKAASGKKGAKAAASQPAAPAPVSAPTPSPALAKVPLAGKLPPVGKAPAGNQISMFNFITGGN